MYKVIHFFTDLQDNNYAYKVGDTFPHEGVVVSEQRLAELSSSKNKQEKPLIEKVPDAEAEDIPEEPAEIAEAESEEEPAEVTEEEPKEATEEKPKKARKNTKKG